MSDQIVRLNNVRLAFGDGIFNAKSIEGSPAAFNCVFLLPPNHPDIPKVKAAMIEAAKGKWGDKGTDILKSLVAGDKVCLRNGDTKSEYDGFPGNLYISARNKARPLVVDADRTPLTEADGRPYSGCYVNATISIWAQANQYGKRVNAQLRGVQFFKDGDSFGGGSVAQVDEFDNVAEGGADAAAPGSDFEDDPIFG
jgi:hypothetical protein